MTQKAGLSSTVLAGFALACSAPASLAVGDPVNGEKVFRRCAPCHEVGDNAKHKTGPALTGVVGAIMGGQEGFEYSQPMAELGASGATWTAELLDRFVTKPREAVPGTRMSFNGLRRENDRTDVIAFLSTFGQSEGEEARDFAVAPEILAIRGDPAYGEYLAGECTTCHQASGRDDGIPSIVNRPEEDFVTAMHAYKDKVRPNPVMQLIAGRLSSEEIAALAVYFKNPEQ